MANFSITNDTRLRRRAASRLAAVEGDEACEYLKKALADPHEQVRFAALEVRGGLYPDDPALAKLLGDQDAGIRTRAVQLIGKYHCDAIIAMLGRSIWRGAIGGVGRRARNWMMRLPVKPWLNPFFRNWKTTAMMLLLQLQIRWQPLLRTGCWGELTAIMDNVKLPLERRLAALKGLAAIGDDEVIQAIIGVIDDDQRQIRLEAMDGARRVWRQVRPNGPTMPLMLF